MTKHVTTVRKIVNAIHNGGIPNLHQLVNIVDDTEYFNFYSQNSKAIDSILVSRYANYVLPDISDPQESTVDIFEEVALVSMQFLDAFKKSLDRLWELESVTFNPVENYDRIEEWSDTRSGAQSNTRTGTSTTAGTNKSDAYSDVTTTDNGKRESTVTENQGATNISSDVTGENTTQTNQINTTTNKGTSYNTNLVDTTTITMTGNPDKTTEKTTTTTASDAVTNTVASSQSAVSDVATFEGGARTTNINNKVTDDYTDTTTYNDVADKHTGRTHGNIGVTTATAMMSEYVNFYTTYNFWVKFWDLYISMFASPFFETDRDFYESFV